MKRILLRRSFGLERAQISSFPSFRIFLPGIQPILPDLSFLIIEDLSCQTKISPRTEEQKNQCREQEKIEREMRGEVPALADMTETAAGDVEAADFCGNCGDEEGRDERG